MSEGNLSRIHNHEMSCIRSALVEFFRETRGDSSCQDGALPTSEYHGVAYYFLESSFLSIQEFSDSYLIFRFYFAPSAYLLCQSQHNIKVVPEDPQNSVKNNVHSGAVLSGEQLQILSGTGLNASSFLLTAHGGLKGTSKPVLYRTLLNENERPSDEDETPLTQENLEHLIYHMSFQYTTATKVSNPCSAPYKNFKLASFSDM